MVFPPVGALSLPRRRQLPTPHYGEVAPLWGMEKEKGGLIKRGTLHHLS